MSLDYRTFVDDLADMTVTGVDKYYDAPPHQIATLPAMFPRLPSGGNSVSAFSGTAGLDAVSVELVIVIESIRQASSTTNFQLGLDLIDALTAALKTKAAANNEVDNWEFRLEVETIGDAPFWLLVAEVNASG